MSEQYTPEYVKAVVAVIETILDGLDRKDREQVLDDLLQLYCVRPK